MLKTAVVLLLILSCLSAVNFTGAQAQAFMLQNYPGLQITSSSCCGSNGQFSKPGVSFSYEYGHPENVRIGDIIVFFNAEPMVQDGQLIQPQLGREVLAHQVIWRNWTHFYSQGTNTTQDDGLFSFEGHFIARRIYDDKTIQSSLCAFAAANRSIAAVYNPGWACGSTLPPPIQSPIADILDALIKFIRSLFGL